MEDNRRRLLGMLALASFGIPLAACSQAQVDQIETSVKDIIQKVQSGVVAAVSTACAWAGKVVPTADTVMTEIVSLLGSPVATALAGPAASAIATLAGAVQGAIDSISAIGIAACPPAPPLPLPPQPTPPPTALAPLPVQKTQKGTPVKFY